MHFFDRTKIRENIEKFGTSLDKYVEENDAKNGLAFKTKEEVLLYIKHLHIDSINLWFTDLFGFLKRFSIPPEELESAFELGVGWDGSSVIRYREIQDSDMVAKPLPETAQLIPYKIGGSKVIRMFVDVYNTDGTLNTHEPRGILRRSLEMLPKHDLTHMNVGPEAEYFYFFDKNSTNVLDTSGYFDIVPGDIGNDLEELTRAALNSMGIPVEYWHHEVGPSQHEIDLKYCKALDMGDRLITHKLLVKEIAERAAGVHATFMPKPLPEKNGSGMHTHLSLWKDNHNAFFEKNDEYHLSKMAKHFIGGILHHVRAITLITNQWHNSFKRLIPGYEAPIYIAWARRNRSALIRIPEYRPGQEDATRIELRFPDPGCNPYLAFAVMLRAGLRGIDRMYPCPDSLEVDLYKIDPEERKKLNVETLPRDLFEAIMEVKNDKKSIVRDTLGKEMTDKLIEEQFKEDMKFRLNISSKEHEEYLKL